jgi:hypothetical protein
MKAEETEVSHRRHADGDPEAESFRFDFMQFDGRGTALLCAFIFASLRLGEKPKDVPDVEPFGPEKISLAKAPRRKRSERHPAGFATTLRARSS